MRKLYQFDIIDISSDKVFIDLWLFSIGSRLVVIFWNMMNMNNYTMLIG
jgi:hypothetical protein